MNITADNRHLNAIEVKAFRTLMGRRLTEAAMTVQQKAHQSERFDWQVIQVMLERIAETFRGDAAHPGYWPQHPSVTQENLSEVWFFPITINGVTLPPAYVLLARNIVRDYMQETETRNYLRAMGLDCDDFFAIFFKQSYLESL